LSTHFNRGKRKKKEKKDRRSSDLLLFYIFFGIVRLGKDMLIVRVGGYSERDSTVTKDREDNHSILGSSITKEIKRLKKKPQTKTNQKLSSKRC